MKFDIDYFYDYLKHNLSLDRYTHSVCVAKLSHDLALVHNYDPDKAYFAGLVHDIAKELSEEEHNSILIENNDLEALKYSYKVKHSFCGKYLLKNKFHIDDDDVLDAVYNHTVLKSDRLLSKIVYIADKRDETREINDDVVKIAMKDLDKAVNILIDSFKKEKDIKLFNSVKDIIDKKFGEDIKIIDFRNNSPFMDYVFICSAKNNRIASSIVNEINKWCKDHSISIKSQDYKSEEWQYIDIGDIVIHIFVGDSREKYSLDDLWKDLIIE